MNKCGRCKETKEETYFSPHKKGKNGLSNWCKACNAEYQKKYGADPAYRKKKRGRRLMKAFGITMEQFEHMYATQDGKCAICHTSLILISTADCGQYSAHVDHDHETGAVRGLLCFRCNSSIGHFEDSIRLLLNAVAYLSKKPTGL